mgnify:CR=1 FL=1
MSTAGRPKRSAIKHLAFALACFATVLVTGCAGYRLGPTNDRQSGARSIQVNPFVNQTIEPRLGDAFGHALRKFLQQDATYRLDTQNTGDVVVSGVITDYQRSYVSFDPKDIITPRDYQLVVKARIVATERGTGKVLVDREVSGHTTVRVGADLNSAERQSVPLLAESLARKATSLLADGDW